MLVRTAAGSSSMPGRPASPWASREAFSWSSGEAGRPLAQGDQAGGGEDPRLAHAAAEHLPHPPGLAG